MYGILPWQFIKLSTRSMFSLAEQIPNRLSEDHAHTAQVAYVMAKVMGGFDGEPSDFLLPFANPGAKAPPVFVSRAVEAGVRQALALQLVSQDMLDTLTRHGYMP